MAEDINLESLRYYVQSHGLPEVLTELNDDGTFVPESWVNIVKGALSFGDSKIAKYIITNHVKGHFLNDLLLSACETDNMEIVELLLQKGAEINAVTNKRSALNTAATHNNLQAVKLLLKRGADPNLVTDSVALHEAIQLKSRKVVEALLKYGASVNSGDISALHWAVRSQDWSVIRLILDKKPADTEIGRSLGYDWIAEIDKLLKMFKKSGLKCTIFPGDTKNCMYKAIRDDDVRGLKELLKHRNVSIVPVGDGLTPLHVATFYKHETVAEVLLSCGADAFSKDLCGDTPVGYAIRNKDFEMLQVFVKMGTTFKEHSEMLLMATMYRLPDFIECIIRHGANVHVKDESDRTSLHIAALHNDEQCVRKLLDAGADPNATRAAGTALHCVITRFGVCNAIAQLLFDHGSDINIVNADGQSAFQKSIKHGPQSIGSFLGQIVKMRKANMYVSEANLDCWAYGWFDEIGDDFFAVNCEKEIEVMKKETIDGLRIYDILVASENRLASLSKNETIQDYTSSGGLDKYAIYSGMIKGRLNLGNIRSLCFERSRTFFDHFEPRLPSICVDKILGYLCNEDLRMLEKVCIEIDNKL